MECEKNENEQKRRRNWSIKNVLTGINAGAKLKKPLATVFA